MAADQKNIRILVVEDETIIALDIEQQLCDLGYQSVGFVTNGEEAIRQCAALSPDLVMMDIQLDGEMDGIAAAQIIRQQFGLPVIMLTAYSSSDIVSRAKVAEPFGYVLKPFSSGELRISIEIALYKYQTEVQLKISDTALRAISQGVLIVDGRRNVTLLNTAFTSITGYTKDDLQDLEWHFLAAANADPRALNTLRNAKQHQFDATCELLCQRKDGSTFWNEMTIAPIMHARGHVTHFVYVVRDVSARKQALDQLRELSSRQMQIKENEQKQIAREIHDDLGSLLYGIQSCLSVLSSDNAAPAPALQQACEMTSTAIATMRQMITQLRPSVLDHLGVWVAMEWYCTQLEQRTTLRCDCVIDDGIDGIAVKPDAATAIFRIVQELLSNVLRHAQASVIEVRVTQQQQSICIEVTDNGIGIENTQILSDKSWGIMGMYERVHPFHGELKIRRHEKGGTVAILHLPLEAIHA